MSNPLAFARNLPELGGELRRSLDRLDAIDAQIAALKKTRRGHIAKLRRQIAKSWDEGEIATAKATQ